MNAYKLSYARLRVSADFTSISLFIASKQLSVTQDKAQPDFILEL
jgi:hypothetical protein